jgi:hypothetical protein
MLSSPDLGRLRAIPPMESSWRLHLASLSAIHTSTHPFHGRAESKLPYHQPALDW